MAQPTPFDTILVQSRDLFCDRLCDAVHGMLDQADKSLTEMAEKFEDAEAWKPYLEARDLVAAQRPAMEKQFRARYLAEFQKRTNQAKKIALSLSDISLGDLELVTDDDLEETLKFNDMAAKLRRFCEEELGALDQRVGVLVGDATLESDANPFGPQVICDAYKQACRHIDSNVSSRLILLKLFDDHVLDTIRSSYKSVNELLVQNSILPKIRYGISKSEGGKTPSLARDGEKDKSEDEKAAPETPQDMFSMIQKLLGPVVAQGGAGGPPAPGMGMGGAPLVQGADLMGSLTRLQVGDVSGVTAPDAGQLAELLAVAKIGTSNVLRELKSTSVGAGMGQVDSMTLDIVAMLFDELFDDPKIPIALKGLIGRLQLPMLKVAIADKDLFTKKGHPARQLLDTLGQIGLRLPADFDAESALFHKLESFMQELVDGFQEKMEIFDTVRERLEEIIAEYDAGVAVEMQSSQKQLEQVESLAIAKAAAQEAIAARLRSATATTPRPIVEFLAQQWIKYLLIVHAREGPESDAWKGALETVDQLLWSVEPKPTVEERRKLASTIPAILKGVRAGVAAAGIDQAACTAFFGELMKCHTDVMQAPAKPKEAPVKTKAAAGAPETGKAAAKKAPPPPPPSADDLLDFTAPVVVDNPFGEGKVEVVSEDLDFTATAPVAVALATTAEPSGAAPARAKRPRETTISLPSRLVEGAWVEIILEDNERHPAKLHYVSPMKSHFLFVDRKGHKVYECSRSMLARRLNNLEIAILDGEPDASLFDRIMESLFGKLGAAAPAATG